MGQIKVCGKKLAVTSDIDRNRTSILESIRQASDAGADILITPEGSLSGYTHEFNQSIVTPALSDIQSVAVERSVGLALGTCFYEEDGNCYNQIRFYRKDGGYLGFHSKILRCGTLETPPTGELNHYSVTPLRTFDWDGIEIAGLICNDLWANPGCTPEPDPHLTQQLSRMGARIIFHAVNGGRSPGPLSKVAWNYHESNLRMRARAAGAWIVTVDNSFPVDQPSSAPSGVLTPGGEWAVKAEDSGESFFSYTISL